MLKKQNIDHILRAAAAVTNQSRFVLVGSGAVIATAHHIPAIMMMTSELDLYVDGHEDLSDLITATIGEGSYFHRTFGYYGDGVDANTSIMLGDWRTRAIPYQVPGEQVAASCASPADIAFAKMAAWREKDVDWLREAFRSGIVRASDLYSLLAQSAGKAPPAEEMQHRFQMLVPNFRKSMTPP